MMRTGLVSVSFRPLDVQTIVTLSANCGLQGIEWGGDIHVPAGDREKALSARKITVDAGLDVSSYGSYYRIGMNGSNFMPEFDKVLSSAVALQAPVIRIWAHDKSISSVTPDQYHLLVSETVAIAEKAVKEGLKIAFECHCNSLTDEYHATLKLMQDVGLENVRMYWQPNDAYVSSYNVDAAKAIAPYVENVHVFNWPRLGVREPLRDAAGIWNDYLDALALDKDKKDHWFLLEFMPDDRPESLKAESATLKGWISARNKK